MDNINVISKICDQLEKILKMMLDLNGKVESNKELYRECFHRVYEDMGKTVKLLTQEPKYIKNEIENNEIRGLYL